MPLSKPEYSFGNTPEPPRLGRILDTLLGSVSYDFSSGPSSFSSVSSPLSLTLAVPNQLINAEDFDSTDDLQIAAVLDPPDTYDSLLRMAEYASPFHTNPLPTPWVTRALSTHTYVSHGAKYKPVHRKVRPVPSYMPNTEAIVFKPIEIGVIPPLTVCPRLLCDFVPTKRLSQDRLDMMLRSIPAGFLSAAEVDLMVDVLVRREKALAFCDNERGVLSRAHFPDYEIPVIEHTPWAINPIRFPAAIADDVRRLLREQVLAGKYEPGYSSYRSRIWAVLKKSGKLRLVLDLQDLNQYVVRDASLPPHPHDFAESCAGHVIYGVADLFSGFDAVTLHVASRDLTTFHAMDDVLRNTCCPQGLTNALQWFQRTSNHAMGDDRPKIANPFIDDLCVKGPRTVYNNETIEGNPNIRRFVYEYATSLDRVFARLIIAGFTASGPKLILATPRVTVVGSTVSAEGWHLEHGIATKVINWPTPRSLTELRGFLGVAGVARRWIKGFSLIAKPLTFLCRKPDHTDEVFEFPQKAQTAMDELKKLIASPPVLRPIDYDATRLISKQSERKLHGEVTVAVDSSMYGAGFILYQQNEIERHPALFGSCTFNRVESKYSQPKLELYGVYRAVRELRHRIWGVFFMLEVDAKFLQQMVKEPDLPNAPMTRWVSYINLFDYDIQHVPAAKGLGQDGLSRRGRDPNDTDESDAERYLDEFFGAAGLARYKGRRLKDINLRALLQYDAMVAGYSIPIGYDLNPTSRINNADHFPGSVSFLGDFDTPKSDAMRTWLERWESAISPVPGMSSPFDSNTRDGVPMWATLRQARTSDRHNWSDNGTPMVPSVSPFHGSFLRNDDDQTFIGLDFMIRRKAVEKTMTVLLGDELTELCYVDYRPAYAYADDPISLELLTDDERERRALQIVDREVRAGEQRKRWGNNSTRFQCHTDNRAECPDPPVLKEREYVSCIGHTHGTKFDEREGLWEDVAHWLKTGERPAFYDDSDDNDRRYKQFAKRFSGYFIHEAAGEELLFRARGTKLPARVIVDKERRKVLIASAHNDCGHRGRDQTFKYLETRYWWPNIYDDVSWFTRSCNTCQKRSKIRPIVPISPTCATVMFRAFVCDTVDMPPGYNGCMCFLHASEAKAKWNEARASRKKDSEAWAKFIWEDIICRFGCIPILICDGGSEFKGAAAILLARYNVTVIVSSPYYPQGNGIAERDGQTLMNAMLRCCGDRISRWPDYLHAALFAVRTSVSRATGYTPFFLLYGQEALLPFDMTDRSWLALDWHNVKSTEDLITLRTKQISRRDEHLGPATEETQRTRQQAIDNFMRKHTTRIASGDYEPGTWVLIHETWLDRQLGNKGALRFSGPYIIHCRHHHNNYRLRELDGSLIREAVPAARLKPFYCREEYQTMPAAIAPLLEYEISYIDGYTPRFAGWTYDRRLHWGTYADESTSSLVKDWIDYQTYALHPKEERDQLLWFDEHAFPYRAIQDPFSGFNAYARTKECDRYVLHCDLQKVLDDAEEARPHW